MGDALFRANFAHFLRMQFLSNQATTQDFNAWRVCAISCEKVFKGAVKTFEAPRTYRTKDSNISLTAWNSFAESFIKIYL